MDPLQAGRQATLEFPNPCIMAGRNSARSGIYCVGLRFVISRSRQACWPLSHRSSTCRLMGPLLPAVARAGCWHMCWLQLGACSHLLWCRQLAVLGQKGQSGGSDPR